MSLQQSWRRLSVWSKLGVVGSLASILSIAIYFLTRAPESAGTQTHITDSSSVKGADSSTVVRVGDVSGGGTVIGKIEAMPQSESPTRKRSVNSRLLDELKTSGPSLVNFVAKLNEVGKAISFGNAQSVCTQITTTVGDVSSSIERIRKVIYDCKDAGTVNAENPSTELLAQLQSHVTKIDQLTKELSTLSVQFDQAQSRVERSIQGRDPAMYIYGEEYRALADKMHKQREAITASLSQSLTEYERIFPKVVKAFDILVENAVAPNSK